LEKHCRPHLKTYTDSWKVDETYIKVRKVWTYLYRAVDSEGNTIEFFLSSTRDAQAARRFFAKALSSSVDSVPHTHQIEEKRTQLTVPEESHARRSVPRVINVDKNAAYPKAIAELKANGMLPASVELRQVKYLNNRIEQDHRFIKRLVKPGMGDQDTHHNRLFMHIDTCAAFMNDLHHGSPTSDLWLSASIERLVRMNDKFLDCCSPLLGWQHSGSSGRTRSTSFRELVASLPLPTSGRSLLR
jgi:transposase-like protein